MSFNKHLEKNLGDYLLRRTQSRPHLRETINRIAENLPDTVIFGGMIREFALGHARDFISDIDLVSSATRAEIHTAIADYNPSQNKFGGYRFVENGQRFDIWSLNDTWAFKQTDNSSPSFEDLLKTTFFNLDAAYYHINKKELATYPNYYIDAQNRILDINFLINPNPAGMAARAISLVLNRKLKLTRRLVRFVVKHASTSEMTWSEEQLISKAREFLTIKRATLFCFDPQSKLHV